MKKTSNFDDAEVYTDSNQCKPIGRLVLVVNLDKAVLDSDAENEKLIAEIRSRNTAAKKSPGVIIAS